MFTIKWIETTIHCKNRTWLCVMISKVSQQFFYLWKKRDQNFLAYFFFMLKFIFRLERNALPHIRFSCQFHEITFSNMQILLVKVFLNTWEYLTSLQAGFPAFHSKVIFQTKSVRTLINPTDKSASARCWMKKLTRLFLRFVRDSVSRTDRFPTTMLMSRNHSVANCSVYEWEVYL